jgi:hypothetical protein
MSEADVSAFFTACLADLICSHLYDQELMPNSTRFDIIAHTRIAAWPVALTTVNALVSDANTLRAMYLVSHAASNECGFNQWAPDGKCVNIAPFERPSAVFVNVVFVVFIVIALIAGAVYFALQLAPDKHEQHEEDSVPVPPLFPVTVPTGNASAYKENELVLVIVKHNEFQPLQRLHSSEASTPDRKHLNIDPMHAKQIQETINSMLVSSHGVEYANARSRRRWN